MLSRHGIVLDLSEGPGLEDRFRFACWPRDGAEAPSLGCGVAEVPIGWDGDGTDLACNYLFNEKTDLDGLKRVWGAILARAARTGRPRAVNVLAHGFGLVEPRWRDQVLAFVRYATRHGGRLVDGSQVANALRSLPEREAVAAPSPA
jgi:hypothetical protein